MDNVKRDQEEHPYAVGLKFGIEENLRVCCEKDFVFVGSRCWVCQRSCKGKDIDIKDLVVAFSFHLLIQKCFPFPYLICVNINNLLLDSLITNMDC